MSDLIDHQSNESNVPTTTDTSTVLAAIRGQGLPSTKDLPKSVTEPSEITDHGHLRYNELKKDNLVPRFPADDDEFEDDLQDRIFEASRENSRDRQDFLPKSQLDRLIHPSSVRVELKRRLPHLTEDIINSYANRICHGRAETIDKSTTEDLVKSYQKVFAVLVLVKKVDTIELFLQEKVCDADLPLQRHQRDKDIGRRKFELRRKKQPGRRLDCFRSWKLVTLRLFEQFQWVMVPPFFTKGKRKNVQHYVLEPSTVLPFIFTENANNNRRGGYSLVYQADIHPDHHNFNDPQRNEQDTSKPSKNTFAIKQLDSPSKEAFQKEVQILKKFSGDAHPHLISLLATFERERVFYLIFPWAGADLKTYWKSKNPTPTHDADTIMWMAEQCSGLAEGLTRLHQYETGLNDQTESLKNEYLAPNAVFNSGKDAVRSGSLYGRHGDIKPENILWFPEPNVSGHKGVLKISDFGLSELNNVTVPKMKNRNSAKTDDGASEDGEQPTIGDQVINHLVESPFDSNREFLPKRYINKIISREAIQEELFFDQALDEQEKALVKFIHAHAKKVFATVYLVLDGGGSLLLDTMRYFQQHNFTDRALPVKNLQRVDDARNSKTKLPFPFDFSQQQPRLRRIWSQIRVRSFYKNQWIFLAPVFTKNTFRHTLHPDIILPFTWKNTVVKEGRFSKVHQVEIHKDHQEQLGLKADGTLTHIAIKEILTADHDEEIQQEVERNFKVEAKALSDIASLKHDHIIERIAAITRGENRYFMFQWADGGNLREFWEDNPWPEFNANLVRQSVTQLRGLADALSALHNYKGEGNYRHGDLKPENILRFKDKTLVGTLKIADMGLAKRHTEATDARLLPTDTKYGTTRYEPPEAITSQLKARSRLYDVWSLGCIILEYIIWFLYGYDGVKEFNKAIRNDTGTGCFYRIEKEGNQTKAEVHPVVVEWMNHLSKDQECSSHTAMRTLLELVRDRLLVVALRPGSETSSDISSTFVSVTPADTSDPPMVGSVRAKAVTACSALQAILDLGDGNEKYLLASKKRSGSRRPSTHAISKSSSSLQVPGSFKPKSNAPTKDASISISKDLFGLKGLNHTWSFYSDNKFASNLVESFDDFPMNLSLSCYEQLCSRCACGFCRLLANACKKAEVSNEVLLQRYGSTLKINDAPLPLLSIVRDPGGNSEIPKYVQVGFPNLPPTRHPLHFEIIRQWLKECDNDPAHDNCQCDENPKLPTRLLDVQTSTIRLIDTEGLQGQYLALSHPWGDPVKHSHFCTYTSNIQKHKAGIDFSILPDTFKDAVTITRELDIKYLWIDSLCIIQGPDGDFTEQSKHMEDVFSSAYCVLAASRAAGQCDGFLGDRVGRDYITFSRGEDEVYHVCEEIDNFQRDVIDGALNQRGWVLQERALARRTIYFTEKQTYWECGGGIRCETFTKLKNNIAAFLGDPKFPEVAMRSTRGEMIYLYQMFYQQYSKLQFSKVEDRPFAIAGLEKRLLQGFTTRGGYGVFDDGKGLLHRSLLWCRSLGGTLGRIKFPVEKKIFVPTWSWMAYEGGIDYLDPEWNKTEWEQKDLRSPWSADSPAQYTTDKNSMISLDATARDFDEAKAVKENITLYFDMPDKADGRTPGLKCVILARPKTGSTTTDRMCYVLLVAPQFTKRSEGLTVFERVGVGKMPESCVSQLDKIEVKLQ
ncbi:putative protein kinase [Colletotrichum tropicale]|nr:putative protein kinase [Colletotrichum tropicale]